jgi:hypothetical protein
LLLSNWKNLAKSESTSKEESEKESEILEDTRRIPQIAASKERPRIYADLRKFQAKQKVEVKLKTTLWVWNWERGKSC